MKGTRVHFGRKASAAHLATSPWVSHWKNDEFFEFPNPAIRAERPQRHLSAGLRHH